MEAALTAKGQATIPKVVRQHLGLKPGDRIKFFFHPEGTVVPLPKRPASTLRGIVPAPARPVTITEMTEVAATGATRHARRADG